MGAPRCPAAGPQAGRMRWHQVPAHRDVPTAMGSISGASSLCWSPWSCPFQGDLGDRGQSSGGTRGFAGGSSMKNTKGKGCWVPHPALGDAGHRHSSAGGTWGCSAACPGRCAQCKGDVKEIVIYYTAGKSWKVWKMCPGRRGWGGLGWRRGGSERPRCSPPRDRCWHRAARGGSDVTTGKKIFTLRVVRCWKRLPSVVVDVLCLAASITCFSCC